MGRPAWLLIVLVVAGCSLCLAFFCYCTVRGMGVDVGATIGFFARCAMGVTMFVGVLVSVPVIGAAGIGAAFSESRARRPRGLCPACAYPRDGVTGEKCPECGFPLHLESVPRDSGRRAMVLCVASGAAALLGCVAAEGWVHLDERRFRAEAIAWEAKGGAGMYFRARRWPLGDSMLIYEPGVGMRATD